MKKCTIASLVLAFGAFAAGPAFAQDALSQLQGVEQTSRAAVVAPSDEGAKNLSSQGFDTPISSGTVSTSSGTVVATPPSSPSPANTPSDK